MTLTLSSNFKCLVQYKHKTAFLDVGYWETAKAFWQTCVMCHARLLHMLQDRPAKKLTKLPQGIIILGIYKGFSIFGLLFPSSFSLNDYITTEHFLCHSTWEVVWLEWEQFISNKTDTIVSNQNLDHCGSIYSLTLLHKFFNTNRGVSHNLG